MKNKLRILPFVLVLGMLTLLPSFLSVHAAVEFAISANSSLIIATAGSPVNVTIIVTRTGGFSGTVSFSTTCGALYTTSFDPTIVTLSSGGQATSTLSITAGPRCPAPHNAVAKGTSGTLVHNTGTTIIADACWQDSAGPN